MILQDVSRETHSFPKWSMAHDLRRAFGNPLAVLNSVCRWALLAHRADLPYAEVVRFRRELSDDREFQEHLQLCRKEIGYVFPGAAELYVIVRAIRPRVIVETGVASGISSAHILRALAANGMGTLHSIDLPNVQHGSGLPAGRTSGWMVPQSLRGPWKLQLGDSRLLLPELLTRLESMDIFLHDSDHSYASMFLEFEQAFPKLRPGGVLMSDDTHLHTAWDDFCAKHKLRPTRIGQLGVTRKR